MSLDAHILCLLCARCLALFATMAWLHPARTIMCSCASASLLKRRPHSHGVAHHKANAEQGAGGNGSDVVVGIFMVLCSPSPQLDRSAHPSEAARATRNHTASSVESERVRRFQATSLELRGLHVAGIQAEGSILFSGCVALVLWSSLLATGQRSRTRTMERNRSGRLCRRCSF